MMKNTGLKYVGNGSIRGVPAHDLTVEEVEKYGGEEYLLSLPAKLYAKPMENKVHFGGKENKEVKNERN